MMVHAQMSGEVAVYIAQACSMGDSGLPGETAECEDTLGILWILSIDY